MIPREVQSGNGNGKKKRLLGGLRAAALPSESSYLAHDSSYLILAMIVIVIGYEVFRLISLLLWSFPPSPLGWVHLFLLPISI